ncbi:MAG: hypothetical protein MAG581_01506 [Deltaproteobacteria bacterium]|jgi:hypothetical protein|nr:hypothetical protein [Deltaproteobacteria bacterium]
MAESWIEMLHYLMEQSFFVDNQRYGDLGEREV